MRSIILVIAIAAFAACATAQTDTLVFPEPQVVPLPDLVRELIMNNQEIEAAAVEMDVQEARIPQAGALPPPEFRFMQEGMPGFRWNEAMYSRYELMQMIPFPGKLGAASDLARVRAEHAHHDHLEKINEVIARLKMAYYELWLAQQSMVLDRENLKLMEQFAAIARTRYSTGNASQSEVLKAQVERAMISNDLLTLRQRELTAKAMIGSLLDREPKDTIGYAVIPETLAFPFQLDTLLATAVRERPMIMHDSAMIHEGEVMLRMARQEYLPDFSFGLERMVSPMPELSAWSVTARMTLPFVPWSIGKVSGQVNEANSSIEKARASYAASRQMVISNVREMYYKADGARARVENFQKTILPETAQALEASLSAYQNGTTDFLMLLDSYRTNLNLRKEYFMARMEFDQSVADLEREVGVMQIASSEH